MTEQPGPHTADLMARISARRASIDGYLRSARPRGKRLANVAIVSSAVAAVTTAGPALGGETFSSGVADTPTGPQPISRRPEPR